MNKKILTGLGLVFLLVLLTLPLSMPALAAPAAQLTVFPTPTPGADGRILYTVQPNDTLWRISAITGIAIDELRALNNLGTDEALREGQVLLIGLAGPVEVTPTSGPSPTPEAAVPTPTPLTSTGDICVLLYLDVNGDGLRQELEVSIPGGAISVNNRSGTVSLTVDTPSGGISDKFYPEPEDLGYTCFKGLSAGEYNITAAAPDGYNETTDANRSLILNPGDQSFLTFGAQEDTETAAEVAIIPETPGRSPVLGIAGAALLLLGVGLGIYAFVMRRTGTRP
ncbi:MAG TPA: LysM peptidoglycan-binding domain-containing protein [Anaerolineales bacterium]|nr:LysM peptidoglycan-binding domain-containing protein [Anaerolineales bacterium]